MKTTYLILREKLLKVQEILEIEAESEAEAKEAARMEADGEPMVKVLDEEFQLLAATESMEPNWV